MKKILLLLTLMLGFLSQAQNKNEWQDWDKTSCYSKIMFRLKYEGKNGSRNIWKVQFRNEFDTIISFNYYASDENSDNQPTTHRKVLNPKTISPELEVYTDTDNIYLVVDKVSLSAYPSNFIDCQ